MRRTGILNASRRAFSIALFAACTPLIAAFQQVPTTAQMTTIRVQSSLVLVDVIAQDLNSGLPVQDFKKGDFRLFDNGHQVPITTFDAGAQYDTRPITVWLVVICNEDGLPKFGASAEFAENESLLRSALDRLENHDAVGVAHWCDNGETKLELLPTTNRDSAIRALAEALKPIPFEGGTSESDEAGELTIHGQRLASRRGHCLSGCVHC